MATDDPIITHFLARRHYYADLVRLGFPIIDGIYWDWPNPVIGGWLLKRLKAARAKDGISAIDLRPPARKARPLGTVVAELEAEHRDGFWYRGQRMRRDCLYAGHIPRMERTAPGINPIRVTLDAVVPSAFRVHTRARPATWPRFRLAPALDYMAGPARAIIASRDPALGELLLSAIDTMLVDAVRIGQAGKVRLGFAPDLLAPGSTAPQAALDLISIAQHYEYGSVMVDVSTSIGAAVWFATRDWTTGEVAGSDDGSPGVIYRIDARAVAGILREHVEGPWASPAMQALGVFGLADISKRFAFLDRPRAQHGGSLLGMENIVTHLLMVFHRAIEVFPFDHGAVTGQETPFGLEDIRPAADRGVAIFRPEAKLSADPLTADELGGFLSAMAVEPARARHLLEMRECGVL